MHICAEINAHNNIFQIILHKRPEYVRASYYGAFIYFIRLAFHFFYLKLYVAITFIYVTVCA